MRAQDISADRGGDGFDERMLRRSLNGHQDGHRRVRQALGKLAPEQRNILELAYGLTFRNRDVETESKRRALRTEERNWRVRLRERFDYLECAAVLASPVARALYHAHEMAHEQAVDAALPPLDERVDAGRKWGSPYEDTVEDRARLRVALPRDVLDVRACEMGFVEWLATTDEKTRSRITANVMGLLMEALKAFAHVYVPPKDEPRLDAVTPRKRNFSRTRARILASHPEHGQEIGR